MTPDEHEHETVLFTVSAEVAQAAIAQVASCEACNPEAAEFPFEVILNRVMLFSGAHTDYFMPEPPAPSMQRWTRRTLVVERDGALTVIVFLQTLRFFSKR
jgi:hypothetical protein